MTRQRSKASLLRGAFTLVELLVVLAILVVLVGVGGYYLLPRVDESKEKAAGAQAKGTLTPACQTYKLNNGEYPPTLEVLGQTQPNGYAPLVSADALMDPWGQPYHYDASGPRNGGMQPDIWAEHGGKQLGNWPTQR